MMKLTNISVQINGQTEPVVQNTTLTVNKGDIHVLMGQNGSGKSSLAQALAGHPHYEITEGSLTVDGQDLTDLSPDKRAKASLFFTMQHPVAVPGVTTTQLLRTSWNALHPNDPISPIEFQKTLYATMDELKMDRSFALRAIHDGFSGGEQKRLELLQLAVLKPSFAVLDELDSGLDVDAVQLIAAQLQDIKQASDLGILLITHSTRLLQTLTPTHVSIMHKGSIVKQGGPELVEQIDQHGYDSVIN